MNTLDKELFRHELQKYLLEFLRNLNNAKSIETFRHNESSSSPFTCRVTCQNDDYHVGFFSDMFNHYKISLVTAWNNLREINIFIDYEDRVFKIKITNNYGQATRVLDFDKVVTEEIMDQFEVFVEQDYNYAFINKG